MYQDIITLQYCNHSIVTQNIIATQYITGI